MSFRWLILGILILCFFAGCARREKGEEPDSDGSTETLPAYRLENVTHYQYEAGDLKIKVIFEKGDFFEEFQELRIEECRFVYYDSNGNSVSRGHSNKATLYEGNSLLVAEDDVVVTSEENGATLKTDYLEWRGDSSQFVTDRFVTITRENGDILQGTGLITDLALNYVTVKRNVEGSMEAE
jgi:LPS export ABC transporter protein LptC